MTRTFALATTTNTISWHERALTGVISFFDVDGTLAAGSKSARKMVRDFFDRHGVFGIMSARTPEMFLSREAILASRKYGFTRPPANPSPYVDSDYLTEPDFIIGFGTQVLLKHGDGYMPDPELEKHAYSDWRRLVIRLLSFIDEDGQITAALPSIEFEQNYFDGTANVYPLAHRVSLHFTGRDAGSEKDAAMLRIRIGLTRFTPVLNGRIRMVDESDPEQDRYILHLIPHHASKEVGVDRIVTHYSSVLGTPTSSQKLLISGDTAADLRAMCFAGYDADVTSILPGRSTLTRYLAGESCGNFPGEALVAFVQRRLKPTNKKGFYKLKAPHRKERTFVIGDEAYPGSIGAETIVEYLTDTQH